MSLLYAFRHDNAAKYRQSREHHEQEASSSAGGASILKHRVVWTCALYLLTYVGTETSISGWVVTFMGRARGAKPFMSSLCSSAFWAGITVGRLTLGPLTDWMGVRRAVTVYFLGAMLMGFLFAAIESVIASIVLLCMVGILFGPLFPSSIVYLASLLSPKLHVAAVSFVASMGQIGGAALPALLGIIAEQVGIRAFQAVIFAQMVITLVCWIIFTHDRSSLTSLWRSEA